MKAEDFDKAFDEGSDVCQYLDVSKARKPNQAHKKIKIDFPIWMFQSLDKEAKRLGVTQQSIIKVWIAERLEKVRSRRLE
ncbi:MAG: CopG family antitoxin [Pseudomonadota bacterium]